MMIQPVLLELHHKGVKHIYPFHLEQYVRHVNSHAGRIDDDPNEQEKYWAHGYISEPSESDMLHLQLSCNGNGCTSAIYVVDRYCGIKHVLDDEIFPSRKKVKIGKTEWSLGQVYYCIIKLKKNVHDPKKDNFLNVEPIVIPCQICE